MISAILCWEDFDSEFQSKVLDHNCFKAIEITALKYRGYTNIYMFRIKKDNK